MRWNKPLLLVLPPSLLYRCRRCSRCLRLSSADKFSVQLHVFHSKIKNVNRLMKTFGNLHHSISLAPTHRIREFIFGEFLTSRSVCYVEFWDVKWQRRKIDSSLVNRSIDSPIRLWPLNVNENFLSVLNDILQKQKYLCARSFACLPTVTHGIMEMRPEWEIRWKRWSGRYTRMPHITIVTTRARTTNTSTRSCFISSVRNNKFFFEIISEIND